jgi:hypothetical protein
MLSKCQYRKTGPIPFLKLMMVTYPLAVVYVVDPKIALHNNLTKEAIARKWKGCVT